MGWGLVAKRQPRPCLNYRVRASGRLTLAWALVPFEGERPDVDVQRKPDGDADIVTVKGPWGSDTLTVDRRGEPNPIRLVRARN